MWAGLAFGRGPQAALDRSACKGRGLLKPRSSPRAGTPGGRADWRGLRLAPGPLAFAGDFGERRCPLPAASPSIEFTGACGPWPERCCDRRNNRRCPRPSRRCRFAHSSSREDRITMGGPPDASTSPGTCSRHRRACCRCRLCRCGARACGGRQRLYPGAAAALAARQRRAERVGQARLQPRLPDPVRHDRDGGPRRDRQADRDDPEVRQGAVPGGHLHDRLDRSPSRPALPSARRASRW